MAGELLEGSDRYPLSHGGKGRSWERLVFGNRYLSGDITLLHRGRRTVGRCLKYHSTLSFILYSGVLPASTSQLHLLITISKSFIHLKVLSFRKIKPRLEDNGVEVVALNCHELQELYISKSLSLTDCSLLVLAHGCPKYTKLVFSMYTGIRHLNLCGCVRAVTDRALL
ncbi:hypothetical protein ZOSMA_72G00320 [Zostera marina]|uniref:Uncharacterized protein n=1 Tax=Zostera marina TaxID=29655 RepID=A0A0K9NS95_ZOSMR|nr:hypothetical protein ZOSMA_72G00320 [Zostera marina]